MGVYKVGRKDLGADPDAVFRAGSLPGDRRVTRKNPAIVKELNVDYGSHVQKDQVMATLEIPELQLQLQQDDAAIKNAARPDYARAE